MTEPPAETPSPAHLSFEGDLNVHNVTEHYAAVLSALEQSQEVEIDLSKVSELDSAGVQLLMLAKRAAQKQQKSLRLVGHSRPVLKVFELLELSSFFGDVQYTYAEQQGAA